MKHVTVGKKRRMPTQAQALATERSSLPRKRLSKHSPMASMSSMVLLLGVAGGTLFSMGPRVLSVHAAPPANTAVVTFKGNNQRTGNFSNETTLTTNNVKMSNFGKRVAYPVDGQVYAEPLYVPNLTVKGRRHNIVFIETEHDSVYAFDANTTTVEAPLWRRSFLSTGAKNVPSADVSCNDLVPSIGITSTPVIDTSTNTMYVVAFTLEKSGLVYRLHALNILTGQDKPGSPTVLDSPFIRVKPRRGVSWRPPRGAREVTPLPHFPMFSPERMETPILKGSVAGTAREAVNGRVAFIPANERQRGALTLVDGQIYIPFAAFCDNTPFHGWIMGYTYSGSAFRRTEIYNDSPNGTGGGIWGAGGAVAADTAGNIYFSSGNGDFTLNQPGGKDAGDAFVKVNAKLQIQDYFSPFNQSCLDQTDAELGSEGPLIITSLGEVIGAGKEGRIYVMNDRNMGKYTVDPHLSCSTIERNRNDIDKVLQETPPSTVGGVFSTPAYWHGTVYFAGAGDHAKAFTLNSHGLLNTPPASETSTSFGVTGNPVISSNGASNGILWVIDPSAVLRAYNATNLAIQLYGSNQNPTRDALDSSVHFASVTVANGEVFVGTQDKLYIYGLHPSSAGTPTRPKKPRPAPTYNNVGITYDNSTTIGNFDGTRGDSYSAAALRSAGINPGDNAFCDPGATPACKPDGKNYGKIVFTWPDVPSGRKDNYVAHGQTIPVMPLRNASVLAFAGTATGGTASGTVTVHYSDGTTQTATLGFDNWHLSGGSSFDAGDMAAMPYYNTQTGQSSTATYVFCAVVPLEAGKTVTSVTLPTTVTGGTMHVFAVATNHGL